MGAGSSVPQVYTEQAARAVVGERWDKTAWNKVAKKQGGVVSPVQLAQMGARADGAEFGGFVEVALLMAKDVPYEKSMFSSAPDGVASVWYKGAEVGAFAIGHKEDKTANGAVKILARSRPVVSFWLSPGDPLELEVRVWTRTVLVVASLTYRGHQEHPRRRRRGACIR